MEMEYCNILWVAWMSRWGESSPTHAYDVGIYNSLEAAERAGKQESLYRGGKYIYLHSPCRVDLEDPFLHSLDNDLVSIDPPEQIYLCEASYRSDRLNKECHHLVGLFTSIQKAESAAKELFPGWRITVTLKNVYL